VATNDTQDQTAAFRATATNLSGYPSCRPQTGPTQDGTIDSISLAADEWERTFDAAPDLLTILDAKHRIVRVNRAMAERLGVTKEECIGELCYARVHGTSEPPSSCPHAQLVEDGKEHTAEIHEASLGGDFLVTASPLLGPDGRISGCVHVARDITAQKQTERMLREKEERFRLLYERSPLGYQSLDENGRFLLVNSAWLQTLGYASDEVVGRWFGDFLAPEYVQRFERNFSRFKAEGEAQGVQFEMLRKDGTRITVEFDGRVGYDNEGNFQQTHCIMRDITQQKQAADKLRESEEKYRALFEQAAASIVIVDADTGKVLEFNERAHRSLGYSREEFSKLSIADVEAAESHADIAKHIEKIRSIGSDTFETRHRTKSGQIRNMLISSRFLPVADRNLLATIWHDITERKQAENELSVAKEAAESASRAKSHFLANMSHEIRTPLSVIMGFTDLLMAVEVAPSERHEHLQTVHRNAEHLLKIIADILDLSKIEADKLDCELADCSVRQVIEEVISSMRPLAERKSLTLDVDYVSPLPDTIRTDPNRLKQILLNLLGNAIKYTEQGGVRITVRYKRPDESGDLMLFEVADTGIGISQEKLAEIFEPFSQADMSLTRRFGGTGLGLTISQQLARMLGGHIHVHSDLSKGSTFTLAIDPGPVNLTEPVKRRPSEALSQREERANLKHLQPLIGRVLLVDDDADIQAMIGVFLKGCGQIDMDIADDGLAGCEMAFASMDQGKPYDLILMDIRMPRLDGLEATGRLRRRGWKGPIVALTAQAMVGDREKCLDAGCDEYLSKPSAPKELLGILSRYLSHGNSGSPTPLAEA